MTRHIVAAVLLAGTVLTGCRVDDDADGTAQPAPPPPQQPANPGGNSQDPQGELSIEVNLEARELYVHRGGQRVETHPVAVGSEEWPTRTGEWTIDEVIFNPEWVPPDEEWAEDEDEVEPGDPENPLGNTQLVYDRPRSIHGTNAPESIGQAVSHGSIRMSNDAIRELARLVMQAGGVDNGDARIQEADANPDQTVTVSLPRPVQVRVN
jgi:lipoprotein-anchoring transpeptidase ErfK/SrfK